MERFLSRWLSPNLLYFLIAFLLLFLAWFIQGALIYDADTKAYTLNNPIAISAVAIIISVLFNGAVKLHSETRDRAFELLLTNRKDENYKAAMSNLAAFFNVNKHLSRDDIIQIYNSSDRDIANLRQDIYLVGNFFEEMAIAIKYKEVNEPILEEFYSGIFIRFYLRISPFLPVLRNQLKPSDSPWGDIIRREVYCELDDLYKNWAPTHRKLVKRLEARAALEAKIESLSLTS